MPVAKEQVGDVPEGLVPAIKLEPPPGFEQDEWEQLTDRFACEADEIDGILDQRGSGGSRKGRPINLSVPYTGSLSGSARAIAQRERKALFDKEEKVLESVRTADRSAKYQLKKSLLQQPKYKLANSARQAKLLEKEWDILSEKRFTQKKSVAKDILAIPIAQVGVERVFNVAKDVIGSRRHRLSARTIQQIMVLKDTISQEEEQGLDYLVAQLGEDGEPIDEVNDLFELPASLEHTFDIDEENQTTEEESEEEVQEERQLPPRKRQRPQRYRDN
ncbi:Dimer-Tnp-hAT domain-containing protein [Pyrenophora tritici-repentis]|nr:Dimer-Tnp-hAT domain-containing protein [Pyrenophora tritici-repentis]